MMPVMSSTPTFSAPQLMLRLLVLTVTVLSLFGGECHGHDNASVKANNGVKRELGLESYLRTTPKPTDAPTTGAPTTLVPSLQPSSHPTRRPSLRPTEQASSEPTKVPSSEPTTRAPTTTKPTSALPTSDSPTSAAPSTSLPSSTPSILLTEEPSSFALVAETAQFEGFTSATRLENPTAVPTTSPTLTPVEVTPAPSTVVPLPAPEPEAEEDSEEGAAAEPAPETEQEHSEEGTSNVAQPGSGEVFVEFSLYTPNVTIMAMNFMKLRMAISNNINKLYCDDVHHSSTTTYGVQQDPAAGGDSEEYCAVKEEQLMLPLTGEDRFHDDHLTTNHTDHDHLHEVTVMALAPTSVKETSGVTITSPTTGKTRSISWTTWRLTWNLQQIGPVLKDYILQTTTPTPTDDAVVNEMALLMVQQMLTRELETSISQGDFGRGISLDMEDITLFASLVGEEVATYSAVEIAEDSASSLSSTTTSGQQEQGLQEGNNGEEDDEDELMAIFFFAGLGVSCAVIVALLFFCFRSRARTPLGRKRTIVILDDTCSTSKSGTESNSHSSRSEERIIVFEEKDKFPNPPPPLPTTRREPSGYLQHVQSLHGRDVESRHHQQQVHWAGQATAASRSISGVSGYSGFEHSDTWSVASMTIDLAEWGNSSSC